MKLTPWFLGTIKPVHIGVYQQMSIGFNNLGYQYWDGVLWHAWADTPEGAYKLRPPPAIHARYQNDDWRGVAK